MVAELDHDDEIRDLWTEYKFLKESVYNDLADSIEKDTAYYDLSKQYDLIPPDWQKRKVPTVVPPTAYTAVENAASHILTQPNIAIPPRPVEHGDRAEQERVERKRAAVRLFWQNVARQGDPVSMGKKKLVKDGIVVFKHLIRWDDIPDDDSPEPIGMSRFPWIVEAIPGETVLPDPDEWWDPPYVFERYLVRCAKAKRRFPEAEGNWQLKRPTDFVEVVEYWSKPAGDSQGEHIIWIDDEAVQRTINPYHYETDKHTEDKPHYDGYVPYIIRPSGWGERTADGNPDKLFVGMIRHAHSVIDAEVQQITSANAQMLQGTFPMIKMLNIPETKKIKLGPGVAIPLEENQDVVPVQLPQVPQSTFEVLNRMQQYVNDLTKFRTLGGVPLTGVDTATESDQVFRSASSTLTSPVNNLTSALEELSRRFLLDVDRIIALPVVMYGDTGSAQQIVLSPADIDGFHRVNVTLTTTDQEVLKRADARLAGDLYVRFPSLSEETALEYAGFDDPTREARQREKEELFRSETQRQFRETAVLATMGPAAQPIQQAFISRISGGPNRPEQGRGFGDELGARGAINQQAAQASRERRPDTENR